jgi:hypothetical protein
MKKTANSHGSKAGDVWDIMKPEKEQNEQFWGT